MWALLSTRLRTWLLFAVAVPVVRAGVHHAARRAEERDPHGTSAGALRRADAALTRLSRRRRR